MSKVFTDLSFSDHEQVVFCHDKTTQLKAIIAIHNTNLGPALGGCRFYNYASEEEAITDVLRLSKGMTYKNALAGIPFGGGKSVIIGDPNKVKSRALLKKFGEYVNRLGGNYITAEDVGTVEDDMIHVNETTDHVTGLPSVCGDPSPATAYGVFQGIKASAMYKLQNDQLSGLKVMVQGLGKVGFELCRLLHAEGAYLYISDLNTDLLAKAESEFNAQIVPTEAVYGLDVDIYAPCAMGATVNENTIPQLKAKIIAGCANNQLATDQDGSRLQEKGILYAPDYVINAGGVIYVANCPTLADKEFAYQKSAMIYETMLEIFHYASEHSLTPGQAANRLAEAKFSGTTDEPNTKLKSA